MAGEQRASLIRDFDDNWGLGEQIEQMRHLAREAGLEEAADWLARLQGIEGVARALGATATAETHCVCPACGYVAHMEKVLGGGGSCPNCEFLPPENGWEAPKGRLLSFAEMVLDNRRCDGVNLGALLRGVRTLGWSR